MIVSRQNQKIKDIRRLRRCKGDRTVLEGPHLLAEALQAGLEPESILATPEYLSRGESRRLLAGTRTPVTEVAPHLIEYLSDADSPRDVLTVISLPRHGVQSLSIHVDGLYLFVDGMQDPGNLGALVRVAEAFGVDAVVLAKGSAHPNHPRSLRASAGSLLRTEVVVDATVDDLRRRLTPIEPSWVALVPRGGQPIRELELAGAIVVAVGAEGPGLSREVLAEAPLRATIPLRGRVESLNATVAAAVALYDLQIRHRRD